MQFTLRANFLWSQQIRFLKRERHLLLRVKHMLCECNHKRCEQYWPIFLCYFLDTWSKDVMRVWLRLFDNRNFAFMDFCGSWLTAFFKCSVKWLVFSEKTFLYLVINTWTRSSNLIPVSGPLGEFSLYMLFILLQLRHNTILVVHAGSLRIKGIT